MAAKNARHKRRGCDGKRKYADCAAAQAKIKRTRGAGLLLPYRCKRCGSWHVGHPPYHVIRAIRRRELRRAEAGTWE